MRMNLRSHHVFPPLQTTFAIPFVALQYVFQAPAEPLSSPQTRARFSNISHQAMLLIVKPFETDPICSITVFSTVLYPPEQKTKRRNREA